LLQVRAHINTQVQAAKAELRAEFQGEAGRSSKRQQELQAALELRFNENCNKLLGQVSPNSC
jgi:hypothetical protein